MKCSGLACFLLLLPLAVGAADTGKGWLCVGSPDFLKAAAPLIQHRRAEGLRVMVFSGPVADAVASCATPPAFILLLGDEVRGAAAEGSKKWRLPATRQPYHGWLQRHPAEFVSDMAWGDLDGDGLPDAAVGRLPARTPAEVTAAAKKIVRWENHEPSLTDMGMPVWAGDPGFSPFFRDMALGFLLSQIQQRAPLWGELWVMQGDERSPFSGWPVDQQGVFNTRLGGGGLLSAMIGHGQTDSWWSMNCSGKRLNYSLTDASRLTAAVPAPPHVIFACSCGNFALTGRDCLAEALFRAPGGPVLCAAAAEDSHPLTNYYHATALLECLNMPPSTFGELWLRSLRKANATTEPEKELFVHTLEPFVIKRQLSTAELRADHAFLYNILGDPATRLFAPQALEAVITEKDGKWNWSVPNPPDGARLLVQQRAPLPAFGNGAPASNRAEAVSRMAGANSELSYQTIAEYPAGKPWQGVTAGRGTLRLVALGKHRLAVAAAAMLPPAADKPPAAGR